VRDEDSLGEASGTGGIDEIGEVIRKVTDRGIVRREVGERGVEDVEKRDGGAVDGRRGLGIEEDEVERGVIDHEAEALVRQT
jgi:hypothetical protein